MRTDPVPPTTQEEKAIKFIAPLKRDSSFTPVYPSSILQILTRISLGDSEPYCPNQEPVEISELCSGAITHDTQFINPELGCGNEIALDFKARLSCFI